MKIVLIVKKRESRWKTYTKLLHAKVVKWLIKMAKKVSDKMVNTDE